MPQPPPLEPPPALVVDPPVPPLATTVMVTVAAGLVSVLSLAVKVKLSVPAYPVVGV